MVKERYGTNPRLSTKPEPRKNDNKGPGPKAEDNYKHNVAGVKKYIEERWARGIPRDYTSPDFWGDRLK